MTRFCVPVYFNEPLSMVQKVAESFEYEHLLNVAGETDDPVERLALIAAFGVAQYKQSDKRMWKPFNPILGETYELVGQDYKYFAEQVSHHPPITASYAES